MSSSPSVPLSNRAPLRGAQSVRRLVYAFLLLGRSTYRNAATERRFLCPDRRHVDSQVMRSALREILDTPGLIDAASKQLYLRDPYDLDPRWEDCTQDMRDLFIDEIRGSLTMLLETLPSGSRSLKAA
jgi:hypothetical protein